MATKRAPRVPGYRLHRPSGQAVVTLAGKDHYLGAHESDESHAKYRRLAAEYVRNGFRAAVVQVGEPYTVALLCDEFLNWAEREYRRGDGQPTGSVENVRLALRTLFDLFADVAAEDFGPKSPVLYQESLAGRGLSRSTTNDRTRIVRQAFKWAVRGENRPESGAPRPSTPARGLTRHLFANREPRRKPSKKQQLASASASARVGRQGSGCHRGRRA